MTELKTALLSTHILSDDDNDGQTAFYANTVYTAVGISNKTVHVFSKDAFQRTFTGLVERIWAFAINDESLFMGDVRGTIHMYDIATGHNIHSLTGHKSCIKKLKSLDRKPHTVISGSQDGEIRIWDAGSGACLALLTDGHTAGSWHLEVDGSTLFSCGTDGYACIWSLESYERLQKWRVFERAIFAFAVGPYWIATGDWDGKIQIWDKIDGSRLACLEGSSQLINGLRLHNNLLVSTDTGGWVKVWSTESFQLLRSVKMYDHAVTTRDVAHGLIVTGGKDGGYESDVCGLDSRLRMWKLDGQGVCERSETVKELGTPATMVMGVAFVGDRIMASMSKRGRPVVEVWRVEGLGS